MVPGPSDRADQEAPTVDPHLLARLLAGVRIGVGIALFAAPRTASRLWLGEATSPAAGVLARGLGARDLALGVGQLVALDMDGDLDPWMDAAVVSDVGDAAAVVLARRDLEPRVVAGTVAMALGAAAAGLALKTSLQAPPAGPRVRRSLPTPAIGYRPAGPGA